jgi:heat shock protein HslJ
MDIKRVALFGATLVLVALLAACSSAEPDQPPGEGVALPGTEWALTSLNGEALIEGTQITLALSAASIEGSAGCNTYGGTYAASGDSLRLSDLYRTEMGCMEPEGILEQELAYLNLLNAVASYRVVTGQLELYDEAGTLTLVFGPRGAEPPGETGSPASPDSPLVATIEAPESLPTAAAVNVKFTLTNASPEGLFVLNWFTPLEGLAGDIFRVQRDGVSLPYQGIQVKRGVPIPEHYVWLDPGGSASAEIDLAEGYDFSQPGRYTIQFRSPRLSHTARTPEEQATSFDELAMMQIPSDPVTVTIR